MSETDPNESLVLVAIDEAVATVRLNRPHVNNALDLALMGALVDTLASLDRDNAVRAIVVTGDDRAFSAGADIADLATMSAVEVHRRPNLDRWERIRKLRKPLIAAVTGYALGGGCELAMACDMIVAGESARFGQPEVNLGIIPGGGGTQRLVRAVGKARAMELILTGRTMGAREAFDAGLVTEVVVDELCVMRAQHLAAIIATKPPLAVQLAKAAILKAFDTALEAGLEFERRSFELLFATDDRREGMHAFLEKRSANFTGQ
jgi:enoyl-CoA hydratase